MVTLLQKILTAWLKKKLEARPKTKMAAQLKKTYGARIKKRLTRDLRKDWRRGTTQRKDGATKNTWKKTCRFPMSRRFIRRDSFLFFFQSRRSWKAKFQPHRSGVFNIISRQSKFAKLRSSRLFLKSRFSTGQYNEPRFKLKNTRHFDF